MGDTSAVVAAIADSDVVVPRNHVVGRVELLPAGLASAPRAHPGVHRVSALEPLLARRRNGAQEAADITGRDADVRAGRRS